MASKAPGRTTLLGERPAGSIGPSAEVVPAGGAAALATCGTIMPSANIRAKTRIPRCREKVVNRVIAVLLLSLPPGEPPLVLLLRQPSTKYLTCLIIAHPIRMAALRR